MMDLMVHKGLEIKKLWLREVKGLAQDHTATSKPTESQTLLISNESVTLNCYKIIILTVTY